MLFDVVLFIILIVLMAFFMIMGARLVDHAEDNLQKVLGMAVQFGAGLFAFWFIGEFIRTIV